MHYCSMILNIKKGGGGSNTFWEEHIFYEFILWRQQLCEYLSTTKILCAVQIRDFTDIYIFYKNQWNFDNLRMLA